MTSCCEKVFVSVSSPQETSHVNASCFGLRISKIFEGSVRISLEEESSTLDDEISALEEESSALDEDTTLLDEENVSLEDETATLDEEDSSAGSLDDELFTPLRELEEFSKTELDELFALLRELDDRATLDDESSALEEESSALDEDTTLLDEENVSLEDETATLDEEDSSAGSLEDERISDQASNALEESSPHAIIKSKAPKGNIFRFINVSLTVFTTVKYTPFIKHSQYFYETKHRFFYKIRHFYKISI